MSNKGKTGKIGKAKDVLTTGDVAKELSIPRRTVTYLANRGFLPTLRRIGDEGHYRFSREEIEKQKVTKVTPSTKLSNQVQLVHLVRWQRQLAHLEDIRQGVKKLYGELTLPLPEHLDISDLSKGQRAFDYPPRLIRWQQADDGSYRLRFSEEFNLVMEHLHSTGNRKLLQKLEEWCQLGGKWVEECHRLQVSTRQLIQEKIKIEKQLGTGQWAHGLYEGFWWTIYSGGFSDRTGDLEYKRTSERNNLCILTELSGPTPLACIYPDEFEAVKTVHRKLGREQRELPLVKGILKMTAEIDSLKELLSHELGEFAKQEIIPGKCSACIA